MKKTPTHFSVNGIDITQFVDHVQLNQIHEPDSDAKVQQWYESIKPAQPFTLTVDFAENRCGNCDAPFATDPAAGVPYVTEPRAFKGMALCPACYVALCTE